MGRSISSVLSSWFLAVCLLLSALVGTVTAGPPDSRVLTSNHTVFGVLCIVKFNDLDGDGKQDPGEGPLSGWVFTVRDAGGNTVATLTTGPNGQACEDLRAGTYTVTETGQAGWTPTTSGGLTQTVVVTAGQTTTVTFGNHRSERGRLCVVKFHDLDGDGFQDPGEPVLFGWTFTIKDSAGNVVGTITTGDFAANCIDLPPGSYTVTETAQSGWSPTTPGGLIQSVVIANNQTATVTFGNHRTETGRLCVNKFHDLDRDGIQDPGEPTLFGWTFTIKDSGGNVVATITTAPGAANCIDVRPGTYTVTETAQPGWVPTTPGGLTQTVVIAANQTATVTFGNHRPEIGRICVIKFHDLNGNGTQDTGEPVLPGWTFTVRDSGGNVVATIITAAGAVTCRDLPPGTYTVTETAQAGWQPTTPGGLTQTAIVVPGQTTTIKFGNRRCCLTFTFLGGKIDGFSQSDGATAEPVTPVSITATPAYFDNRQGNRAFAHRFYLGSGNCIQSATLQARLRALPGGASNDTMGLKVPGSSSWAKPISAIAPTGTWAPSATKVVTFNLGAMPAGGGSTNLIPALNAIRRLDINIQDDTSVDYIRLIVVFCECVRQ